MVFTFPFCDFIVSYFLEKVKIFFEKKLEELCLEGHAVGAVRRTKSMT